MGKSTVFFYASVGTTVFCIFLIIAIDTGPSAWVPIYTAADTPQFHPKISLNQTATTGFVSSISSTPSTSLIRIASPTSSLSRSVSSTSWPWVASSTSSLPRVVSSSSPSTPTGDHRPVQVIIVTRARSGSSFAGELFNNNPEFAYFYEPFIDIVGSGYSAGRVRLQPFDKRVHVPKLRAIMKCNFSGTNYKWVNRREFPIFCGHSKTFNRTTLCDMYHGHLRAKIESQRDINKIIESSCRSQRHVAIKTIRVPDIGSLQDLVSDPTLNVKIIHLVRDPRAVVLSRQKVEGFKTDVHHCDELTNNLNFWKAPPDWLKGRHMLLRYEDLADDPLHITQQIYRFLGLEVPLAVKTWLQINTNTKGNTWDPFSRSRVSNKTAFAWREKIKYETCLYTERRCRVPLMWAGYRTVTSMSDLRNMNVPIMTSFPYPLLPNITATAPGSGAAVITSSQMTRIRESPPPRPRRQQVDHVINTINGATKLRRQNIKRTF